MNYIAIMAGGVGSRFWPASRSAQPKQFLDILGVGKSLLQLTYDRMLKVVPKENILVVTNFVYFDLVKKHLPDLTDNQILLEPSRNNTAPCVAYTAFKLYNADKDANFAVVPSDHVILKEDVFTDCLKMAFEFTAKTDAVVTLGITPTRPDTGYGYINFAKRDANDDGLFKVKQFVEKPNLETAKEYLADGNYVWNAGIFVSSSKTMRKAFKTHSPEIFDILTKGDDLYNSAAEQKFINEFYPTTPNISIDYAIAEKYDAVYTIPADFGWSDLGTWASLYEELGKDENQNVVQGDNLMLYNTSNCLLRVPKGKLVVIKDLDGYIVVDEGDILLIHPKSKEQEIKKVTQVVEAKKGADYV